MTASDYGVSFGYKAQDGQYYGPHGSVGLYHRGNDRPTPSGTPIVIAGVTIGKTGATGIVSGPHLHTQAGTDQACSKDIDPSPLEFKPGTVVAVATAPQWGKYVTIRVGNQFITYCHMSEQNVSVGQVIGGATTNQGGQEEMIDKDTLARLYVGMLGREVDQGAVDHYVGHYPTSFVILDLYQSQERADYNKSTASNRDNLSRDEQQLADLRSQLVQAGSDRDAATKTADEAKAQLESLTVQVSDLTQQLEAAKTVVPVTVVQKTSDASVDVPVQVVPVASSVEVQLPVAAAVAAKNAPAVKGVRTGLQTIAGGVITYSGLLLADPNFQAALSTGVGKYVAPALLGLGLSSGVVSAVVNLLEDRLTKSKTA